MQLPKDQFHKYMVSNHYQQLVPRSELSQQENFRYYEQYKKLYYTAFCIHSQFNQLDKLKLELQEKVGTTETNIQSYKRNNRNSNEDRLHAEKPRRFRRTNQMIDKPYRCIFSKCDKAYASQGSLQQHIKLKHDEQSPPEVHHQLIRVRIAKRDDRNIETSKNKKSVSEGFQNHSEVEEEQNKKGENPFKRQQRYSQDQNSQEFEQYEESSEPPSKQKQSVKHENEAKEIKQQVNE